MGGGFGGSATYNEIMQGGVLGGSTAIVKQLPDRYFPTGGIAGGGFSLVTLTSQNTSSGGIVIGGLSPLAFTFTPSGGIAGGSSALAYTAFNLTGSAGAVVSGFANTGQGSIVFYVASGGIKGGGLTANNKINNPAITSAGAKIGSLKYFGIYQYRVKFTVPAGKVNSYLNNFYLGFHFEHPLIMSNNFKVTDLNDQNLPFDVRFLSLGNRVTVFCKANIATTGFSGYLYF